MGNSRVVVRPAAQTDLGFMKEMLYEAANRPGDEWPPFDDCLDAPRNRRFWHGFPRDGDIAVIAETDADPVGAAWIRRFVGDELGPIDDPEIPVLAIGVVEAERGKGLGGQLMGELVRLASERDVEAINLTTGLFNTAALRLYERQGFQEVFRRGDGIQMRLDMGKQDVERSAGDVMRAMVAAFDTGHVDDLEAVLHPRYLDHQGLPHIQPTEGVDGFRHIVEVARSGYVELSVEIADLIEGQDRSAARLVWTGVRPSGEREQRQTLEIVRVESGRAVEHWGGHC